MPQPQVLREKAVALGAKVNTLRSKPDRRADFPRCPAWFNEGLASLDEQSSAKNGRIHGKINWRYQSLEQAIKDKRLISFQQLRATSDEAFYGGANKPNYNQHYAQARYLCYYLPEKGAADEILSRVRGECEERSDGLQHVEARAGRGGPGRVPEEVEEVHAGAALVGGLVRPTRHYFLPTLSRLWGRR
jgi:hypothetical protein